MKRLIAKLGLRLARVYYKQQRVSCSGCVTLIPWEEDWWR